ncbi:MAG: helix-turn-helix domain-containing protein [candidate division WOR-3 bacterium]|nr:helix-turn-helix domain-containing protein [candidate division WOR-3 bacterium]
MSKTRIRYMDIVTKVKPEERGLIYEYRRSFVEEYLRIGSYRKAADKSDVNVKTVIKRVRRHRQDGLQGLKDRSRRPHRSHRKVIRELEQEILTDYGMIPWVLILPPVFLDSSMVLVNNKKSTNLYPQSLYHHVCGHPGLPAATSAVRLPVSDFAEAMLSTTGC